MTLGSLNLLIVDTSEDFRLTLEQHLQSDYTVHHCADGAKALAVCKELVPDLLIMDLMLTGMDGITLLNEIQAAGLHPRVLIVTVMHTPYIFEAADILGVDYVMRKPCQPSAIVQRVHDLAKRIPETQRIMEDPMAYLNDFLKTLHISTRHYGFLYLCEAVLLRSSKPDAALTKVIYPAVAEMHEGVTWEQVERSIRSAVFSGWKKSGSTEWAELYPDVFRGVSKCPSSGDIIFRLAEHLQRKRGK